LLCIVLPGVLFGCATGEVEISSEQQVADLIQMAEEAMLEGVADEAEPSLIPQATLALPEDIAIFARSDNPSDDELVQIAIHSLTFDISPLPWWWRGWNIDVDENAEPFGEEFEAFRPVGRFDSIAEMQAATEQIMSRRFAEANFYGALEVFMVGDQEVRTFLEADGRLYFNTYGNGGWMWAVPVEGSVAWRGEDRALLEIVTVLPSSTQADTYDYLQYFIELIRENGIWVLDSFPELEGNRSTCFT